SLRRAQIIADRLHLSGFERPEDRLPRHLPQCLRQRRAHRVTGGVAACASRLKQRIRSLRGCGSNSDEQNQKKTTCTRHIDGWIIRDLICIIPLLAKEGWSLTSYISQCVLK